MSKESPELSGPDHRVGRQGQVFEAAAGIESVVQASQAADGADTEEFATDFVMVWQWYGSATGSWTR
jgi:hypothetical protein